MQTGQVDEGTASIALRKPSATICLLVTPIADYALFATVTTVAQAGGLAVWWTFPGRANPGLGGSIVANVLLFALAELKGIANPLTLIGPVP